MPRERHTIAPLHQARAVPGNTKKTTFDAWNGYHSHQKTGISPPLLPPGADTATALPHRATSPQGTPTRHGTMQSYLTLAEKRSV